MNEYLYKLTLRSDLYDPTNWTDRENDIVQLHFRHLQDLLAQDILILAGKTDGLDPNGLGIVIFKAVDMEQATIIMNQDPAIQAGIMQGALFAYNVALYNPTYKKE